ncbi:MAG: hypothetical protein FGM27_04910 [Candidatus Omnitrophica bacterium]|nr:hypothetical protein [Candidatus Omnitrophota bacterium]
MKKTIFIPAAVLTAALFFSGTQAQAWFGGECKKSRACSWKHGKAGMHRQMVSSGDGVIVLEGSKLYKYDAELNLIKEQTIPVQAAANGAGHQGCSKPSAKASCCHGKACGDCGDCGK